MPAGKHRVLGEEPATVQNLPSPAYPQDLHALANQGAGHRVAVGVNRDEPIVGHDALSEHGGKKARLAGRGHKMGRFLGKALDRALVRGAVDALIGDLGKPEKKLRVEVGKIAKAPPGQEVALEVLDVYYLILCLTVSVPMLDEIVAVRRA